VDEVVIGLQGRGQHAGVNARTASHQAFVAVHAGMRAPPVVITGRIKLAHIDAGFHGDRKKAAAKQATREMTERIGTLQKKLQANADRAVVIVLQGMDASGKDGTIRKLLRYANPAAVKTTSFKAPSKEEEAHDFLWRVHRAIPAYGMIGVFNRSHYEAVLAERVVDRVSAAACRRRFRQIVEFERMLSENGVVLLKFFLHLSRREQSTRVRERLEKPSKRWKFSPEDLESHRRWEEYLAAYEEMINATSHPAARWHVIPADRKWYRNYLVAQIMMRALESLKMKWPAARRRPTSNSER
jgi:PPK2 family polyphosphate:nucleotide phosphotransferase